MEQSSAKLCERGNSSLSGKSGEDDATAHGPGVGDASRWHRSGELKRRMGADDTLTAVNGEALREKSAARRTGNDDTGSEA